MAIVRPVIVAHRENPAPSDVRLLPVASDAEPTEFSVFMSGRGQHRQLAGTERHWDGVRGAHAFASHAGHAALAPSKHRFSRAGLRVLALQMTSWGNCVSGPPGACW
jgi:hypothetical protein